MNIRLRSALVPLSGVHPRRRAHALECHIDGRWLVISTYAQPAEAHSALSLVRDMLCERASVHPRAVKRFLRVRTVAV